MSEQYPEISFRTQGQYRTPGFTDHMANWREHVVEKLQSVEDLARAIQEQIESGNVVPDEYFEDVRRNLKELRGDLDFIDYETYRWGDEV